MAPAPIPTIRMDDATRDALAAAPLPSTTELADPARQQAALKALAAEVPGLDLLLRRALEATSAAGGVIIANCAVRPDPVVAVLSSAFGAVDHTGNGIPSTLVFDVTPRITETGPSQAGTSRGLGDFGLHTDSATFSRPHAYVTLACVSAEAGHGGESLLVSAAALADALHGQGARGCLDALARPEFPFAGTPGHDEAVYGPILWQEDGGWRVRYNGKFVAPDGDARPLDDEQAGALAEFEAVLRTPGLVEEFLLVPNDLFVLDNRRWLHGRRRFTAASNRLLKRCKIYAS
jgi:hypothetical protein